MTLTFRCNDSLWTVPDNVIALHNENVEIVNELDGDGSERKFLIGAEVDGDYVTAIAFANELLVGA